MPPDRDLRSTPESALAAVENTPLSCDNDALARALSATVDAPPGSSPEQLEAEARAVRSAEQGEVPSRIGRYAVLRRLGQGAMGVVYSAYDPELDRKVAIKLLRDAANGRTIGRQRVFQEAQAMARVSHPNVVHIYEVGEELGEHGGRVFLSMEFIPGLSLSRWEEQHPLRDQLSLDQRLRLYLQAAMGLAAAHQSGLIHRDFKPDNVLVGEDGRARVVDFGLARALNSAVADEPASGAARPASGSGSGGHSSRERLTQDGTIMGTPGYMSPEQVSSREVDARSDQWSFCAALYEALYGQLPFECETFEQFSKKVLVGKLPARLPSPLGGVEVPAVIEQALRRGLALDPAARFDSMQTLIATLEMGLLPDADSVASQRIKWSSIIAVPVLLGLILILYRGLAAPSRLSTTVPPRSALLAWIVLVAYLLNLVRARALVLKQPTYRRLAYFPLLACSYIAVGRTLGCLCGIAAGHYLILETLGIIALLFSQLSAGRYYLYPIAVCVASIVLLILRPEHRVFYAYVNYIAFAILVAYGNIKASRASAAGRPADRSDAQSRPSETLERPAGHG